MEEEITLSKKERKALKRQNKEDERVRQIRDRKIKKYFIISIVAIVIIVAFAGLWKLSQQLTAKFPSSAELLQAQSNDWTKGNPDSNVILIEYLDFECEACGAYYPLVKRLLEEYDDKVLFISRYFPLSGHKNGMTSALAVEAAGKQGKYWEMYNLLFEQQKNWGEKKSSDPTIFEQYAKQLNLDIEQLKKDVNSKEVKNRVIKDKNSGNRLGVSSTPTFFFNGKKIQNPRGYEAFKLLFDNALLQ